MKNKILCVTKEEAEAIKENSICNKDIFFVEIDGAKIRNEEEYVQAMADAFAFSHKLPGRKLGWYMDYICDLMWIEKNDIVILIRDYDSMLIDDIVTKKIIMDDFVEIILPWWEGEVVGHMVGGKPRGFLIYLEKEYK